MLLSRSNFGLKLIYRSIVRYPLEIGQSSPVAFDQWLQQTSDWMERVLNGGLESAIEVFTHTSEGSEVVLLRGMECVAPFFPFGTAVPALSRNDVLLSLERRSSSRGILGSSSPSPISFSRHSL